jgi:hypothetical protein
MLAARVEQKNGHLMGRKWERIVNGQGDRTSQGQLPPMHREDFADAT